MAQRIVVDPITRIEGHLRIEAIVDGGKITDAISAGTVWRGLEPILKGRDPRDAWVVTQRICGVCTHTHALASVRAVEDALGITIPKTANIIRNIMAATQDVHDHTVHFYNLHGLDWINVVSALKADPAQTSSIAASISNWHLNSPNYFKDMQAKLQQVVDSGQLGIFNKGYWTHPAFKLDPEVNLLGAAHYLEALNWQKDIVKIHGIFGGKNPHPNYVVGGMPCSINLNDQNVINMERLNLVKSKIDAAKTFVEQVYYPDIMAIAAAYKEDLWGKGVINYMSYGDYPTEDITKTGSFLIPRGIVMGGNLSDIRDIDLNNKEQIQEFVSHSWFKYNSPDEGLHPYDGKTERSYDGPDLPYTQLDETKGYSWSKTPRWQGEPMEVGPLARVVVSYAKGDSTMTGLVDEALGTLGLGLDALHSTLGRTLARALEARHRVTLLSNFYDDLIKHIQEEGGKDAKEGVKTFDDSKWNPDTWPTECEGVGFVEAPRGSLGHWIRIKNKKIDNYQAVVPTTWNASPRDAQGKQGPYEVAVMDTPMANSQEPLELLRTIHSYDPCIACATHLLDPNGKEHMTVKAK